MQERSNVLTALIDYFSDFTNHSIALDRISGDDAEKFALEISPSDVWKKKYVDGGGIKKLLFSFTGLEPYDGNPSTQIDNMNFYLDLLDWIENNNQKNILPKWEGAQSVNVLSSGYMMFADETTARYQVQLEFLYLVNN